MDIHLYLDESILIRKGKLDLYQAQNAGIIPWKSNIPFKDPSNPEFHNGL